MGKKVQAEKQEEISVEKIQKIIVKTKEEFLAQKKKRINVVKQKLAKFITLDQKQIKKAATELLKYRESIKQEDLLDIKDDFIYLEVVLNKVPVKFTIRPVQIELPHPIYTMDMNSKFCVISSDPQRAYKDKIADMNIPLIQKVIGYSKLKKNYSTYADKRKLFYEFDLFFCEQSVYSSLSKPLGKIFYERKKIPFPLAGEPTEEMLNKLGRCTYFVQGNGPVYTLKIGRAAQKAEEIAANVSKAVFDVLPFIMHEKGMSLSCLRSLSLKLSNSVSLPFYTRLSVREVEVWKSQNKK